MCIFLRNFNIKMTKYQNICVHKTFKKYWSRYRDTSPSITWYHKYRLILVFKLWMKQSVTHRFGQIAFEASFCSEFVVSCCKEEKLAA